MRFALNVGSQVSLDNFSLSQLIIAIKELFEKEGLPGFLRAYLKIVEVMLFESGAECKYCGSEHLHGHATVTKTLKTSIGVATIDLARLRCQVCKKQS